ncbi:MAG: patatin-like phospholipase family protein [Bacteroidota bacterium]
MLHLKDADIQHQRKVAFFNRASNCFGGSALMMSGGGQLGNFHAGVLKALIENGLLPDVISGASAGGIFAALLGTHTDEELLEILQPENFITILELEAGAYSDMIQKNRRLGLDKLQQIFDAIIPNLTFQEAFEKTGRKINISISPNGKHQKSRLLNAITAPNVMIHSAIFATSAVPGVYPPVTLKAKNIHGEIVDYLPSRRWVDGSMANDLPAKVLSRLYGVNHFIVSLTNPLVLPFVNSSFNNLEFLEPYKKLGIAFWKETSQFNYSISQRFFKYLPSQVALTASSINSIVQQNYSGDINIIAQFNMVPPHKLLSPMPPDDLAALMRKGEKRAWAQLETIRITTKIGRVLSGIMEKKGAQ